MQTANQILTANKTTPSRRNVGSRTFAFRMRAGNTYVVKLELAQSMGWPARMLVYAIEQNGAGEQLQRIESATSEDELRACRAASTAETGG